VTYAKRAYKGAVVLRIYLLYIVSLVEKQSQYIVESSFSTTAPFHQVNFFLRTLRAKASIINLGSAHRYVYAF
jgi:hypothetical protein